MNLSANYAITQDDTDKAITPLLELYVQADASGACLGVKGDLGEGERILADVSLSVHNGSLMLRVHRKGFAADTYSLAELPKQLSPGVLLKIDGGVVHEVVSNVPGIDVRAFDQDKFEECGPEDPDQGEIIFPIEHGSLDTEEDWARYRPTGTSYGRKEDMNG